VLEQHQCATAIFEREDLSKHLHIPRYTTLIRQDLSLFQLTKVKHHTTSVASCKPGRKEQVRLRIDSLCLVQYQGATTCLPWTPGSLCATGAHGKLSALQQSHCDLSACLPAASTYMCSTQPFDSHAHLGTCAARWHFHSSSSLGLHHSTHNSALLLHTIYVPTIHSQYKQAGLG